MNFIIGSFEFYCKSQHKQVKWDICKSYGSFPYLQSSTLFK